MKLTATKFSRFKFHLNMVLKNVKTPQNQKFS